MRWAGFALWIVAWAALIAGFHQAFVLVGEAASAWTYLGHFVLGIALLFAVGWIGPAARKPERMLALARRRLRSRG